MPTTTKELAEYIGVSRATIDRVLNGRAGVSEKTTRNVLQAIEELGFERNTFASNLAKNKKYRFLFLIPDYGGEFVEKVHSNIKHISRVFKSDNIDISYKGFSNTDRNTTIESLSQITSDSFDGVAIMSPESPRIRDCLLRLKNRGVSVVRFISGNPNEERTTFVGLNNYSAGATAAKLLGNFCKSKTGNIAVIAENIRSSDSVERRKGFDSIMQSYFPDLNILPTLETHNDINKTEKIFFNLYNASNNIVGIYILGNEATYSLKAISKYQNLKDSAIVAHEKTPVTVSNLKSGVIDALITHNTLNVLNNTVHLLKNQCENIQEQGTIKKINVKILLKENLSNDDI